MKNSKKENNITENKKTFKILSIDGGGVKGYFPVYVFHKLKKDHGIDVLKEFDLFVGTSIGALITAFIVSGKWKIEELLKLLEKSDDFFEHKYSILQRTVEPFIPKYKRDGLYGVVGKYFKDLKLKDFKPKKPWIATTTNFTQGKPGVIGTKGIKHLNQKYQDLTVRDAIMASSAAPTFLPPYKNAKNNELYLDGGLWANNPTMVGLHFAKKSFDLDYKDISILSFGTTDVENKEFVFQEGIKGLLSIDSNEFAQLVSSVMYANQNFASFMAADILEERYLRVSPKEGNKVITRLDKIDEKFINVAKISYEEYKDAIIKFIKTGKNPIYNQGDEKRYN